MNRTTKVAVGWVSGVVIATLLSACGSGGSGNIDVTPAPTPTLVGTFTDAPVKGLFYTTNSSSGGCTPTSACVTDSMGQFRYAPGDTVNFFASGIYIGSASPSISADGSTTVTPMTLVPSATSINDNIVTTIASFLSTLNAVSVASGKGESGVYVLPNDAALVAILNTGGILTTSNLQTAVNTVYPALGVTVPNAADAQAALQQGINSQGIIGTAWSGTCSCGGGGKFYFQPNGTVVGFTQDGGTLSGSWAGLAAGGVAVSLVSSKGDYTKGGVIATKSSVGTAQYFSSAGALQGTYSFAKISSAATLANSTYLGGWYAAFTPNAAGTAAGFGTGGSAYFISAPDGNLYGLGNDGSHYSGTWAVGTGVGSASATTPGKSTAVSVDLASGTGSLTNSGVLVGTLAFSRTGALSVTPSTGTASAIPLLLNVSVSWANSAASVSNFALSLNVLDGKGAMVANAIKAESTAFRADGKRTSMTDVISVSYPKGGASSYSLQVDTPALGTACTVSGGSGPVSDVSSGNAGAYPAVAISCN